MGKAIAHRREAKNDNLPTPYSMTEQLLQNEKFDFYKSILDPACGNGAIVKILQQEFSVLSVVGFDIKKSDEFYDYDFLNVNLKNLIIRPYPYIITNPPFSLWDRFIQRAKHIATEKFIFLGDMDFLTGIDRYTKKLYFDGYYGLARVYEFVRKCDLRHELREDGKYPAGMQHYGWYVFQKGWTKDYFECRWINNQDYILSKKESTCLCELCKKEKGTEGENIMSGNKLDYYKLTKNARAMGISVHLLIKREIDYRECGKYEGNCTICENLRFYGNDIKTQRKQCDIIGVNNDFYCDVDNLHICDFFEKISRPERFNYKKFIQGENNGSN